MPFKPPSSFRITKPIPGMPPGVPLKFIRFKGIGTLTGAATHFAPTLKNPVVGTGAPPMISAATMEGLPAWVRETFGERTLLRANEAATMDLEAIDDPGCFIPQAVMTRFLFEVERRTAEPDLGLLLVPHLGFRSYGPWADHVLGAETLEQALARAISTLGYHTRGDRMSLSVTQGKAKLKYFNASRHREGYTHVATGSAAVLVDLISSFSQPNWRPMMIGLDLPAPPWTGIYEDGFGCPVVFEADSVTIVFDAQLLCARKTSPVRTEVVTRQDLARLRFGPDSFDDVSGAVVATVWAQVLSGGTSIEAAAQSLDTSVRSLQRTLNRNGTDFRGLVNRVRAERARELLESTQWSVTEISNELGYSAPASFSRAFRKAMGHAPAEFRARRRAGDID